MIANRQHNTNCEWDAWRECIRHWKAYLICWGLAISLAIIVCSGIPKTYSSQVKIADEHFETDLLLGLNNITSWAKEALNEHKGLRMPEVYYRLISSPSFAEEMSKVWVPNYNTDYYHYILQNHQLSRWERMALWLKKDTQTENERVFDIIHKQIRAKVSAKYGTTTMQVTDQNPVVAAMMVDSVREHLQQHLAEYARTRAIRDFNTSSNKLQRARLRYEKARDEYIKFRDSHNDLTSVKASSIEEHLLNEYESACISYSKEQEQYIRAKAFVDKFSFKFAVLKNATVPLESSGPHFLGYAMAFLFLSTVFISWWFLGLRTYKEYKKKE